MATETETNVQTDKASWSETAYEWLQRSKRQGVPCDPPTAAWAFVRRCGINFVDAALSRRVADLPVVEIRGPPGTGKTWTLATLAARFVWATCPSRFQATSNTEIPQVVILDGSRDMTCRRITRVVQSVLLKQGGDHMTEKKLRTQLSSCLTRIHIVFADGVATSACVPTLEALRGKLSQFNHPTLVLWDDFGTEPANETQKWEMMRQLTRLLKDCSILLVLTRPEQTRSNIGSTFENMVTHRIRLQHRSSEHGHDFEAIINGQETTVPYSLSLEGILS